MSEETGAVPAPYILDVSVLKEIARGDIGTMLYVQGLDSDGRPLVIPVLAVTAASLDMRTDDAAALLAGLAMLEHAQAAPVLDAGQAVRLAGVIASTDLDPWDAHVAAVADASVCSIVTLDAAKWRQHLHDLDYPLQVIEIADPEE